MNHDEADRLLDNLLARYEGTSFTDDDRDRYVNSLATTDLERASTAVDAWRENWFPTVADLHGRISAQNQPEQIPAGPAEKLPRDKAFEAFMSGYRRARSEAGEDLETIDRKGRAYFTRWWKDLAPANG